jgi:hypothetical protein
MDTKEEVVANAEMEVLFVASEKEHFQEVVTSEGVRKSEFSTTPEGVITHRSK